MVLSISDNVFKRLTPRTLRGETTNPNVGFQLNTHEQQSIYSTADQPLSQLSVSHSVQESFKRWKRFLQLSNSRRTVSLTHPRGLIFELS